MENNILKYRKTLFFVFLLIAYHVIINFIWIAKSTAPVPWDQAGHTRLAIQFAHYFSSLGFLRIVDYFSVSTYYPPLLHTIVGLLIVFFGHPVQISEITVTVFFAISIFLVFIYTLDLFKRPSIALVSTIAFSFMPIIVEHSRWMLLEIPLLTLVLASLICLNRSETFSNRRYTQLFFIFAALATITKWLAPAYLAFPVGLALFKWLKNHDRAPLERLAKPVLIFLLIALPWYILNLKGFIDGAVTYYQGAGSVPSHVLSFQNFIYYIYLFINFQLSMFPAIIFIIGLIYFVLKFKSGQKLLVSGSILFIYLSFSLILNKDWRYTMPVVPFSAMIIGICLVKLRDKFKIIGSIAIFLAVLLLIGYHLILSFRPLDFHYQRAINFPVVGWIDYVNINDSLVRAANNSYWPQKEILLSISNNKPALILCLTDQERFNAGNLFLERDMLGFNKINVESPPWIVFSNQQQIQDYLSKFSYILITNKDLVFVATRNTPVFMQLANYIRSQNTGFIKIKSYPLPNGDILDLYQKTTQ